MFKWSRVGRSCLHTMFQVFSDDGMSITGATPTPFSWISATGVWGRWIQSEHIHDNGWLWRMLQQTELDRLVGS